MDFVKAGKLVIKGLVCTFFFFLTEGRNLKVMKAIFGYFEDETVTSSGDISDCRV